MGSVPTRPFAVVTGGSTGIGRELARQFVKHGYDVLIVADDDAVDATARELGMADGARVYGRRIDLAEPIGVDRLWTEIQRLHRPVDAIALNAGVGVDGKFVETDLDAEIQMIDLNCTSVVRLAKRVLPGMVERGRGRVLITASVAATTPATYMAVYGATKAFDLQLAEALREELADTGVTVTALQPGPTDTRFFERAEMQDTKVGAEDKDDPALVAEQAFEGMMKGKDKVLAGSVKSRVMGAMNEILPEPMKAKRHAKLAKPGSAKH